MATYLSAKRRLKVFAPADGLASNFVAAVERFID
jgi:hypothetical protein